MPSVASDKARLAASVVLPSLSKRRGDKDDLDRLNPHGALQGETIARIAPRKTVPGASIA